jgi:(1->4)-alpha-D-glucan 1-alpha-D-glucosylmutase
MLKKLKSGFERGSLDIATMLRRFFDGRVKLFVTWRGLDARQRHREVFRDGTYTAMHSDSPHVVAFTRGDEIFVAVPRLTSRLVQTGTPPIGDAWGEIRVSAPSGSWKNVFTGDTLVVEGESAQVAKVFERFPVAIFERA